MAGEDPELVAFGAYIRWRRGERLLSQRQLAETAGMSKASLGQIERGEHRPSRQTLNKLAGSLNVPGSSLLALVGHVSRMGEVQRWIAAYVAGPPGEACNSWPFAVPNDSQGRAEAYNPRTKRRDAAYRVVWEAAHGVPFPDGKEACHSCGNGHLGCVNWTHIRPGTHLDNMADMRAHLRAARGNASGKAIISERDIIDMCERLQAGAAYREVASEYGISPTTVGQIWHGQRWKHVSCPRFADIPQTCKQCGVPLPQGSRADRQYCGAGKCRNKQAPR